MFFQILYKISFKCLNIEIAFEFLHLMHSVGYDYLKSEYFCDTSGRDAVL